MASKTVSRPKPPRLKVGQRVLLHRAGGRRVRAVLIEDRGSIGVGGRRLWRIRETGGDPQLPPREYEVPAVELTPLPPSPAARRPRRTSRAVARPAVH